jgi:hypothetical protein
LTKLQESHLSIHAPSTFLSEHWKQLLPDWDCPVLSVLIYLQPSPVDLCDRTQQTEIAKKKLRDTFLDRAQHWHQIVTQNGFLGEPFDPKFGTPVYSSTGPWLLDDVAVAHALLQFPISEQGGCRLLSHPELNTAVFPSTFLSSASPNVLQHLLNPREGLITLLSFGDGRGLHKPHLAPTGFGDHLAPPTDHS